MAEVEPNMDEIFLEQEETLHIAIELETFLAYLHGADEYYIAALVDKLNTYTRPLRRQPIGIDNIAYINPEQPDEIVTCTIEDEDVIVGRFEKFELQEKEGQVPLIAVKMFVNVAPDLALGVFREEVLPLWLPEEQVLRWPNFNYQPRPKPSFWYRVLRLA